MEVKFNAGDKIAIPEGCKAIIKDESVVFEKEFKDGDVLVNNNVIFIYRKQETQKATYYVCTYAEEINYGKSTINRYAGYIEEARHATEEEKQLLFDKMKEQDLRWNDEEKKVEKIRWRARKGEEYRFMNTDLTIIYTTELGDDVDTNRYDALNYFHTKEQAKEAAKRVEEVLCKYHEDIGE